MDRLVLVGGGINHYEIIRALAAKKEFSRQVILIADRNKIFDESLMPHYLCGKVSLAQCQFDLWKACQRAGVEFLFDRVLHLDRENGFLELEKSGRLSYGELSIECASEAILPLTQDAASLLQAKPLDQLVSRLDDFFNEVRKHSPREVRVALSGNNSFVIDMALAIKQRLNTICRRSEVILFTQEKKNFRDLVGLQRRSLLKKMQALGFRFEREKRVELFSQNTLTFTDQSRMDVDLFIPFEQFRPLESFAKRLASSSQSIVVTPQLQYHRDPQIFIHGACVSLSNAGGEQALLDFKEQREVLKKNLLRTDLDAPLIDYRFLQKKQREFLLDEKKATRFYGPFSWKSADMEDWLLGLRESISEKHKMDLSEKAQSRNQALESFEDNHARRPWKTQYYQNRVAQEQRLQMVSTHGYNWWGSHAVSARYLTELVLAKALCQGVVPESLRLSMVIPRGDKDWSQYLFQSTLRAVERVADEQSVHLAGGDTLNGEEWSLALTVAGSQSPQNFMSYRPGDYILLTRPLGLGLLWSSRLYDRFDSSWFDLAVQHSIFPGIEPFYNFLQKYQVSRAEMVEEWGFLYHSLQSVPANHQLMINFRELPKWPGVEEILKEGVVSPSLDSNWKRVESKLGFSRDNVSKVNTILWDSRSHGAIALGVHREVWREALADLQKMGLTHSTLIGCIRPQQSKNQAVLSDWSVE